MTRPPLDEAVAYARYVAHYGACEVCQGVHACDTGKALFKAWSEADRYAARLAETDVSAGFIPRIAPEVSDEDEYTGRPE